ncbi:coiled-coil domain-containing protein 124 [Cyclospora cayetanensis]|uniref:Coiled-coil domain-containing protein 124 n=1 Tax=Cyclospora cayetanensis TaxID=88456 RepID=A0A6P6RR08_9EIME|nr:coiled-coil domain-containing protein 124 [Cyclospora cayetanensis]
MPVRVNQRAVEARERKAAAAAAKAAAAEQEAERKKWEDNDRLVSRKLDRKAETLQKAEERLQRKQELRKLAEQEMQTLAGNYTKKNPSSTKLTRAEILRRQLKAAAIEKESVTPSDDGSLPSLEPNINHLIRAETLQAQLEGKNLVSASSIDDALSQLMVSDAPGEDRHPERRMKAAFRVYEEQMMPRLKVENPTLKRSQLMELLLKQWKKAPENPFNQTS